MRFDFAAAGYGPGLRLASGHREVIGICGSRVYWSFSRSWWRRAARLPRHSFLHFRSFHQFKFLQFLHFLHFLKFPKFLRFRRHLRLRT